MGWQFLGWKLSNIRGGVWWSGNGDGGWGFLSDAFSPQCWWRIVLFIVSPFVVTTAARRARVSRVTQLLALVLQLSTVCWYWLQVLGSIFHYIQSSRDSDSNIWVYDSGSIYRWSQIQPVSFVWQRYNTSDCGRIYIEMIIKHPWWGVTIFLLQSCGQL